MSTRNQRRQLKKHTDKHPFMLTPVPEKKWPKSTTTNRIGVWVSRQYLVQAFDETVVIRLSINRTAVNSHGRWKDNITWDELQKIKQQVGYGDSYAVEVFPRDVDVVNVANMRHLWVFQEPLPGVGWMKKEKEPEE